MSIDVAPLFQGCEDLAARTPNELARGLMGSSILAIAGEVNALKAKGASVANFTVGDFSPDHFRIPPAFRDGIIAQLDQGKTNYPPAVGVPELHKAIRALYKRELGLDYPDGTVQIGSGARPPLYGLFATVLGPGDVLVYPVPSWNNNYYAYLNQAKGIAVDTKPENGFLPTVEDLAPYLPIAQVISLNSPLNPTGTAFTEPQLRAICEAILAENKRRAAIGDRPLILLYDQCYWQLTFGDTKHFTPVGLIPEMARYTVFVDAISKCWAATGVRLGWSVSPPWIRNRMQPLIGHIGAWAPCAEQHAAAKLLEDPAILADWKPVFSDAVEGRLVRLRDGIRAMKAEGLPVDCLDAQGALYLSVHFDLLGRRIGGQEIKTDEDLRKYLLEKTHTAVVPFTSFGFTRDSGWVRFSVGAVGHADIDGALERIRATLKADLG